MKYIIGNLKMNLDQESINNYIEEFKDFYKRDVYLMFAPSNIYLKDFLENNLPTVCQNAYYEDKGAFTGETSFKQIKSIGVNYALIGHSERRNIFNETDTIVNLKVSSCIRNNINPIICIGETKEDKENNKTFEILKKQLEVALSGVLIDKNTIIAYEPIWSIGTGLIPTKEEIQKTVNFINEHLQKSYGKKIPIVYGGSVNENNIKEIINIENVDGVLVGGASIEAYKFLNLINNV